MNEIISKTTPTRENKYNQKQQLITIQGLLTSQRQLKGKDEPYYYAFVKLKGQNADLPVIFKQQLTELPLKKGDSVILTGHYSNSAKNIRKSFTCSAAELAQITQLRQQLAQD